MSSARPLPGLRQEEDPIEMFPSPNEAHGAGGIYTEDIRESTPIEAQKRKSASKDDLTAKRVSRDEGRWCGYKVSSQQAAHNLLRGHHLLAQRDREQMVQERESC